MLVTSAVSLLSFLYYFRRGEILLYGDAVAHINIARRVFDSQTPGLLQLGTVWLPLPHLLMLPFVWPDMLWRSGLGGSIPSMVAFVFAVVGVFRLTLMLLQSGKRTQSKARPAAWMAAFVFGANPNLLYLQATAMTETLYLALFVWAVFHFLAWLNRAATADGEGQGVSHARLWKCAACLAGAELTRYDGWFLAAAIAASVTFVALRRWSDRRLRVAWVKFGLAIAAAPALWLAYNAAVYGDPLEFARGPYSAKAIEQRTAKPGYAGHPGSGNLVVATSFFLKAGQLNVAMGNWGRIWVLVILAGLIVALRAALHGWTVLLLGVPLIFYATSIAYGGVPLFLPTWWPFTWYNIRYGLQVLPLFAVAAGLVFAWLAAHLAHGWYRCAAMALTVFVSVCYVLIWRADPLCFTEAWVNSRTKLTLETSVARFVEALPQKTRYLMYVGGHVGAFQQAGIPLRQVINEGNHRPWKKPSDPEGLWERALANPAQFADVVIAYDGDATDLQVNKGGLELLTEIHTLGQPAARIYLTRGMNQPR